MKKMSEEKILKLSDLYDVKTDEPELELRVKMLNINPGYNNKLMETCKVLNEYCQYVSRVREYAKEMPIADALEETEKYIDEICKIAEKYAPDYDVDAICDEVIESGITE